MQGLMVVGFIVDEILLRVGLKNDKVTGARNIGQGQQVNVGAESRHRGEAICKV